MTTMVLADGAARATAGLELRGLVKSFRTPRGVVRAVQGIDVSIAVGETVALLGPNGAGKSTTIDMLLGLTEPDGGSVSIFRMAPAEAIAAGAIGAMLQTGGLIRDLTVLELVAMMASLYPARSASTRCSTSPASRRSPNNGRRSSPVARRSACASRSRS
jgi:ABC-2 type transport system ATP-binding protein